MSYSNWQESRLSNKLDSNEIITIDNIWNEAQNLYARATWFGWVDHGTRHVLQVLKNVDVLIPEDIHQVIEQEEAFVLIVGTLLHDIGMIPPRECNYGT